MKFTLTVLALVLFSCLLSLAQSAVLPPTMRHAQELQTQNETSFSRRTPPSPESLRAAAHELARLAQSIPVDIQKANRGLLSKDLAQRLKQIEKLSKRLRSIVSLTIRPASEHRISGAFMCPTSAFNG